MRYRSHHLLGRGCLTWPLLLLPVALVLAAKPSKDPERRFVSTGADGRLVYETDPKGNRVVDFSRCGYEGGGVALPEVPVRVVVPPSREDNGERIQAALDYVAQLPADRHGLRGAVLLLAGEHPVAGRLRISASGVVLRGQGEHQTILRATGTNRRTLIQIVGRPDRPGPSPLRFTVADAYVPVGSRRLRLNTTHGLKAGDRVRLEHPGTAAWIAALGMNRFPSDKDDSWLDWRPGTMPIRWDREIVALEGDTVTLDAPVTTALDAAHDASTVEVPDCSGRLRQVGVENLRCESAFDSRHPRDEEHAWTAIRLEAAEDAWVRQVSMAHFAGSAVSIGGSCRAITVEDCTALQPISEIGGYRRHTFYTAGQLTLFQRCRSEEGRHDFAVGYLAAGPNAFVDCTATAAHNFSGPIESWASGVLYDNVTIDGGGLELTNREIDDQGIGWAAANCVLWQCSASVIVCRQPPTAQNWAVGCWGQFVGDGHWRSMNEFVKPVSLYRAQLADRLGEQAVANLHARPIPADPGKALPIDQVSRPRSAQGLARVPPAPPLTVRKGWLVRGGQLLTGSRLDTDWWLGSMVPGRAGEYKPAVTRFAPGRTGTAFTDDLDELTENMHSRHQVRFDHHWGLWYDRRRIDHERVRRPDGNVWPPFFEQPWARSGQGTAWDGLSKYDLTAFNPWYFGRLKEFADLCDRKGLVLFQQMYFQHNILEAGAHWADFPWRPANCLQEVGFPEPPPYAGDKRIFMAEAFYDVTHPVRRQLHRAYIRHCLDTLGDNTNVVYCTGEEYTGPLAFVEFWMDTVTGWQKETGRRVLIGLSCTKDVQDAILADPVRGPEVAVIDMKFWWPTADGKLYDPPGGTNLSPRQQLREWQGGKSRSDAQTARLVRDYRRRYPDKAVVCSFNPVNGWAVVAAGASLPDLPAGTPTELLEALPRMRPIEGQADKQWGLAEPGRQYLMYVASGSKVVLDLSDAEGTYSVSWIEPSTGKRISDPDKVQGGKMVELPVRGSKPCLVWLTREEK